MTYNRSQNQSGVYGLGSSFSFLDGVPFKIGTAFNPPKKTVLPPELMHLTSSCPALQEEYLFSTEEGVLTWARAREEAKAKAAAAEKVRSSERVRAALEAARSDSSSDDDDDDENVSERQQPNTGNAGGVQAVKTKPEVPVKPPWQLQTASSMGGTILTPVPILSSQALMSKLRSPIGPPKAFFDFALFEKEDDPFDNLELQTIDDMEELKTLLNTTSAKASDQNHQATVESTPSDNLNSTIESDSVTLDDFSLASHVVALPDASSADTSSASEAVDNSASGQTGNANSVAQPSSMSNSGYFIEPTGDGDYVQIRPDYSQQLTVSLHQDSPVAETSVPSLSADSSLNARFAVELPPQFAGSKLFKPVLPPIQPRVQSLGISSNTETGVTANHQHNPSSASRHASKHRYSMPVDVMSQSAYANLGPGSDYNSEYSNMPAPKFSQSAMSQSACYSSDFMYANQSRIKSSGGSVSNFCHVNTSSSLDYTNEANLDRTEYINGSDLSRSVYVNRDDVDRPSILRSAHSNPDLSVSEEISHSQFPVSHSPPVSQAWNPLKPLPPTPLSRSPDLRFADSGRTPSPIRQQRPTPLPRSLALTSASEFDPYNSLSNEHKTFVNNLTSMGFTQSRAARAVQKFGADEKEVLDHLLNVDKLVEKKFRPELAETGLQLFKNDIKKAEQYLDLFLQFSELGFAEDRIQTALVQHHLDRDKALDFLTT